MYKSISGVYLIENLINKKVYIGSSVSITSRFNDHKKQLRKNIHSNKYLQNAWDKYGEDNFKFSILELTSKNNLIILEQNYLDKFKSYIHNNGYNICQKAYSRLGVKFSDISKQKMSQTRLGLIAKGKISPKPPSWLGKKHSKKTILKMRTAQLGKKFSFQHKENIRKSHLGIIASKETKLNMRLYKLGKKRGPYKLKRAVL